MQETMRLFGIFIVFFSIEIQKLSFLFENKNAVEYIPQETHRDGGDSTCKIVVDMALFQKADSQTIAYPTDHIYQYKFENQLLVFLFIDQRTICGEIECNADDIAEERGQNVRVRNVKKIDDPQQQCIYTPPECRIQDGYQYEPDELGFKISL